MKSVVSSTDIARIRSAMNRNAPCRTPTRIGRSWLRSRERSTPSSAIRLWSSLWLMMTRPGYAIVSAGGDERRQRTLGGQAGGGLARRLSRGKGADLHAVANAAALIALDHPRVVTGGGQRRAGGLGARRGVVGRHPP